MGSRGDSYDNALAGTVMGLSNTEGLLESMSYLPSAEDEEQDSRGQGSQATELALA